MYRLIALDIDGTLLNSRQELTHGTADAIRHAVSRGILVTVCTGRSLPSAASAVEGLTLNAPFVLNNGAMIYDVPRRRPGTSGICRRKSHAIPSNCFEACGSIPSYTAHCPKCATSTTTVSIPRTVPSSTTPRRTPSVFHRVQDVCDFLRQEVTCISCNERIERIRECETCMREQLPDAQVTLEISPWDPRYGHVTVMPAGVSKGDGLGRLALMLGIDLAEVMAVGDNLNDLEMLDVAGLGVAMGNAAPETRARADYITTSVEDDGVARAIERFIR